MANKRLSAVITIGGAVASSLTSALSSTRSGLNAVGQSVRNLRQQQQMLGSSIQTFGRMGRSVDSLRARYAAVNVQLQRQLALQRQLQAAHNGVASGRSAMAGAGMAIGAAAAVASVGLAPIVQAASFEKAMLGVAKQVDGARDSSGKLTAVYYQMGESIQQLGREIPIATNEIAEMVAAGARMGIAKGELIEFTRLSAEMATAFDQPAAELADSMGKIRGIFKIPMAEMRGLGDSINYLDDNAISKGSDIIKVLQGDLAGAASTMGLSAKNAAALASTFLTLGESAERADTAASGMLREMANAKMNPKRFQQGLEMIGMTGEQMNKGMINDAQGTILKVLDTIKKLPKEKQMEAVTRLFGKDWGGAVAKLAGGVEEYRRQIALANGEAAKGSMGREFSAQLQSTNAQWEIAKNHLTEISVNIGSALLPAVNQLLAGLSRGATVVADFVRENKELVSNIATVGGTFGALFVAMKTGAFVVGLVTSAFNVLRIALLTNPIGLLLTLITVAAVLIYKNWEPIKAFFIDLWNSIVPMAVKAWEVIKALFAWTPIGMVMRAWEPLREFFTGLWADITATATKALDWILQKISAIGSGWQKTKEFFGFGDAPAGAAPASASLAAPAMPAQAGSSMTRAATTNQTNTFNITQQPGQDSKALAAEVSKLLKNKQAVDSRSLNYDQMGNAW